MCEPRTSKGRAAVSMSFSACTAVLSPVSAALPCDIGEAAYFPGWANEIDVTPLCAQPDAGAKLMAQMEEQYARNIWALARGRPPARNVEVKVYMTDYLDAFKADSGAVAAKLRAVEGMARWDALRCVGAHLSPDVLIIGSAVLRHI